MFLSKYLYGKVMGTNAKFVSVILGSEELKFLKKYHVEYHKEEGRYIVNCDELRALFCNC